MHLMRALEPPLAALAAHAGIPDGENWNKQRNEIESKPRRIALSWIESQSLLRRYGDTFERGLANFETLMAAVGALTERNDARGECSRSRIPTYDILIRIGLTIWLKLARHVIG